MVSAQLYEAESAIFVGCLPVLLDASDYRYRYSTHQREQGIEQKRTPSLSMNSLRFRVLSSCQFIGYTVRWSRRHFHWATRLGAPQETIARPATGSNIASSTTGGVPDSLYRDLEVAAQWRTTKSTWDPEFCRKVVESYNQYLRHLVDAKNKGTFDELLSAKGENYERLLSPETVVVAFKSLLKCKFDSPIDLARTVRKWESQLGILGHTQLTDHLSLRLLTANAKAGNLGRCLSLLNLRKEKGYAVRKREIEYAIRSIRIATASTTAQRSSAGATAATTAPNFAQQRVKNIFLADRDQPSTDNPTRWLDAILIHMKQRDFPLTTTMANRMLQCYSGVGHTGKAVHHFYRVQRTLVDGVTDTSEDLPKERLYDPTLKRHVVAPTKVHLSYRNPPPFFKVPSQTQYRHMTLDASTLKTRGDRESESEFSAPLTAAFAFSHSLQLGACGHAPILLNVHSYNALIKACVYRGALWRAMHVLDTMIPQARDITGQPLQPNKLSYNLILSGLARVGDIVSAQNYYQKMTMKSKLQPDSFTVRAIVEGLLNLADGPGAITATQDFFNQHNVLPPMSTHCKILETCLATGMVYEAKRYVYFIQQLWRWKPNMYHTDQFADTMRAVQNHPQLQKEALQQLFAYFGERLEESDFL